MGHKKIPYVGPWTVANDDSMMAFDNLAEAEQFARQSGLSGDCIIRIDPSRCEIEVIGPNAQPVSPPAAIRDEVQAKSFMEAKRNES